MPEPRAVGSPLWWVERLDKARRKRNERLKVYDEYYRGDHPLLFATNKFLEAFGGMFTEFADNWCDLVVDAVEERLNVEGFRFRAPSQRKARGENPDQDAWRIWQTNNLDCESQLAHTEAILKEESYALVWVGADDEPVVTVEDPVQVIVECEPGNRRKRAAALKVFRDDWTGRELATLYLPDAIHKFQRRAATEATTGIAGTGWLPRTGEGETEIANPLGVVPMVPLVNRPRLLVAGQSEIEKVIPIQDGVNKLVTDMLVASEYGAFRQRWATGMEIPVDPVTKQPVEDLKATMSRFWTAEDKDAKFGQFEATDLSNFVAAIEMLVQHIASQTRTPPHYFYLKGQFPSGESIKSAETGLVAKARRKTRSFGESWEETIRLAFKVKGDPRANAVDAETIWGDLESRSESEHADAQVKKLTLGVPWEQNMEDLGYSPQQIVRMKELRKEDVALGLTPRPPATPPTGTPPTDTVDE